MGGPSKTERLRDELSHPRLSYGATEGLLPAMLNLLLRLHRLIYGPDVEGLQ